MNNAGDLNDYMFEQLERLNELDASGDREALMAEVRRADAVCKVGTTIIANARNVLDAQRLREEWTGAGQPTVPKMLDA